MRILLAVFFALIFLTGITATAFAANPFDVPANHWSYEALAKLAGAGIIDGYSEDAFRGNTPINRYEMAKIVAKAMTSASKADADNRALIDKLAVEFEPELRTLGTPVAIAENKDKAVTSKPAAKPNFTIESETLLQYQGDSPPAGAAGLRGNDRMTWRERLYLNATVNKDTTFDARIATSLGRLGNSASSVSSGNDLFIDRAYFTTKNAFGLDKIVWGRQPMLWGQGALSWKTGNNDGVTAFKKIGHSANLQMGAYVANPQSNDPIESDAKELQFANIGFQVNPKLQVNTAYYNSNQSLAPSSSLYNYGFNQSKGWDVGFSQKLGAWTLNGEYAGTTLDSAVNTASHPKMYAIQITNGPNLPQYFYPVQRFIVDYKKPHTDAFALSYRSVEKGAVPFANGFAFGKASLSPLYKLNNNAVGASIMDNTKGYFFTYENVIAQGIVLSFEYQDLKFKDSGSSFDKIFTTSLQMVF